MVSRLPDVLIGALTIARRVSQSGRSRSVVTASRNVTHPDRVKVGHLGEDGGFGTAHADSGASRGSEGIEATRVEHPSDRARDGSVARDRAAVSGGAGGRPGLWPARTASGEAGRVQRVSTGAD